MKGKQGVSMQSIEYAPRKKGNVLCRNCTHLIFKTTGNGRTKDTKCNHWCEVKGRPAWYTSQCYCKQFEAKADEGSRTDQRIASLLQKRAEQVKEEKRMRKARKRSKQ